MCQGGLNSSECDRVKGFGPIEEQGVKRSSLSFKDFNKSTDYVDRLRCRAMCTKTNLGGADFVIKEELKTMLKKIL